MRKFMVGGTWFLALCAVVVLLAVESATGADTPQEKIQQLERFLKENPGVFDKKVHNELRHLYITSNPPNPRKSMEHSNVILQHSVMDGYILNILSDWQIDKNTSTARANLLRSAQSFPDLRFIAAACFLKIGGLYAAEGNLNEAKSSYLKVAQDKSSDMTQYRGLAEQKLGEQKTQPAPTPPVAKPVPTPTPRPQEAKSPRQEVASQQAQAIQPAPLISVLGNARQAVTFLTQMITLAMQNGGEGKDTQLEALKQQIEALPKPKRGDRKSARLQHDKGLEEFKKERYEQALQFFLAAYQLDAGDVEVVNNVGMAYLKIGNLQEAARYLGGALSLAPNRAAAWGNLAEVFARDSRPEEAVAAYALTYRYSKNQDATRRFLEAQTTNDYNPQVVQASKVALALPLISGRTESGEPAPTPTPPPQEAKSPRQEVASHQAIQFAHPEAIGRFRWIRTPQNCLIWAPTTPDDPPDKILHDVQQIESCKGNKAYGLVRLRDYSQRYFYDGFLVAPDKGCFDDIVAYKPQRLHAGHDKWLPLIYVGDMPQKDTELIAKFGEGTTIWVQPGDEPSREENRGPIPSAQLCTDPVAQSYGGSSLFEANAIFVLAPNTSKLEDISVTIAEQLAASATQLVNEESRKRTRTVKSALPGGFVVGTERVTDSGFKYLNKVYISGYDSPDIYATVGLSNMKVVPGGTRIQVQEAKAAERARQLEVERRAQIKERIANFFQKAGSTELVDAGSLQSNPFRYEGDNIVVLATYRMMLDKNTSIFETRDGILAVSGLDPKHSIRQGDEVLLAGTVTGTSQVPTPMKGSITAPLLSFRDIYVCQSNNCAEKESYTAIPTPPVPQPVPTPIPPQEQQPSGIFDLTPVVLKGAKCGVGLIPGGSLIGQFEIVGFIQHADTASGLIAVVKDVHSGNLIRVPLQIVRLFPHEVCVEAIAEILAPGQLGALEQCLAASTPQELACLQNMLEQIGLGSTVQVVIPPGVTPPEPVPAPLRP